MIFIDFALIMIIYVVVMLYFKARGIRDDMILYNADVQKINKVTRIIQELLTKQEIEWKKVRKNC